MRRYTTDVIEPALMEATLSVRVLDLTNFVPVKEADNNDAVPSESVVD